MVTAARLLQRVLPPSARCRLSLHPFSEYRIAEANTVSSKPAGRLNCELIAYIHGKLVNAALGVIKQSAPSSAGRAGYLGPMAMHEQPQLYAIPLAEPGTRVFFSEHPSSLPTGHLHTICLLSGVFSPPRAARSPARLAGPHAAWMSELWPLAGDSGGGGGGNRGGGNGGGSTGGGSTGSSGGGVEAVEVAGLDLAAGDLEALLAALPRVKVGVTARCLARGLGTPASSCFHLTRHPSCPSYCV